jgi:hypothetical protein
MLREMLDGKRRMVAALVSRVPDGQLRTVSDVGHSQLCFRRPGVVAQAIREVVGRVAGA